MKLHRIALLTITLTACATSGGRDKGARWVEVESPARTEGRRFALVVGIDTFEDARFTPLRYPGKDATEVAAALAGYERVVQLTGDQTRRPTVLAALEEMLREANSPSDTVAVYISSHGSLAQRPGGGLERVIVTRDARQDVLLQTGIPVEELVQRLEGAQARRRLLVLALCHSGKGKSQLPDALAKALAQHKAPLALENRSEATIVLTACAFGETARESDELGHDVYTHFLLEGLQKGDLDGDGAVTASEAHDYARVRTYAFTQGAQRPTSESEVLGVDPIVLRGKRCAAARPVIFSYARSAEGVAVHIDGQEKGTLPGSMSLEPGEHRLTLVDSTNARTLFSGEIALEQDERQDVAALLPPPPALELALAGGARVPLGGPLRAVVPTAGGARVRVAATGLARTGMITEATLGYWQWSGTAPGIDATLDTVIRDFTADAALGYRLRLSGSWRLDGLLVGGGSWIRRELSIPGFSGAEGTLTPVAGLRARTVYEPVAWPVFLAVSADAALQWPKIEGRMRMSGSLGFAIEAGFRP